MSIYVSKWVGVYVNVCIHVNVCCMYVIGCTVIKYFAFRYEYKIRTQINETKRNKTNMTEKNNNKCLRNNYEENIYVFLTFCVIYIDY